MIYYKYSPHYYSRPVNLNTKYTNTTTLYNRDFSATRQQKNTKENHFQTYSTNYQTTQSIKPKIEEIPHKSNDDAAFEIFGIKLFFDDILLICLIFFLYNEGVQDQYLFITLILLLLS